LGQWDLADEPELFLVHALLDLGVRRRPVLAGLGDAPSLDVALLVLLWTLRG